MSVPDLPAPDPGDPARRDGDDPGGGAESRDDSHAGSSAGAREAEQAEVDLAFAALVAGWDHPGAPERSPAPPATGHAAPRRIEPAAPRPVEPTAPPAPVPAAPDDGAAAEDELLEEDEGHWEPADPPALPRLSGAAVGGLLLVLAGVGLLVAPGVVGLTDGVGLPLGLVAVAGGLGWLLSRLRADPDPDSGWDDGARL